MTADRTGVVRGTMVVLDANVPELEGQRVRVLLEPLAADVAPPTAAGAPPAVDSSEMAYVPPMAQLMGRTIVSHAADGAVELQFEGSHAFTNRHGSIQGGMLSAMLDSSLGIAVLSLLAPGERAVTVEMSTRYFRPAQPGPIRARASVLYRSKTLAHAEANLYDAAGKLLAHATGSMRIKGGAATEKSG